MRKNLVGAGARELKYEIREIVELANQIKSYGVNITWENIGDPVAKGESIPEWMKKIVIEACEKDSTYGYCPTKGLETAREFIANRRKNLSKDDIIFFNGLGDAINKIYTNLSFDARVIGPNPAYSTHSSAEANHAGSEHITYSLDPNNGWNPDLEELENKVKYNPNIAGILVVNPDNPTGAVFKKEVLEKIIDIARRYSLFVVFDEIYEKLVYNIEDRVILSDIIGEVPGISMKGASKDLPWPGARCGWIEIYNADKDANFREYVKSILNSKMLEVCSTTLPQAVLPTIYSSPEYEKYRLQRIEKYKTRAKLATEILGDLDLISVVEPKGAFYLSITFNTEKFPSSPSLAIENKDLKEFIEGKMSGLRFDKRFCYYLLASTGICSVPLSGFNSHYNGFRITLLEENLDKYKSILQTIREAIIEFSK
ncbi:MAG: pyridoxal phosphate-dependent aminotransferase [Candidatus Gracilibacteria bacterium]|nr:pyridoxal phosphate-dependent aminotransferase [Candidatus Gracilibacteria bacterium]